MNSLLMMYFPLLVVLLAAGLDYLLGDPWGWPHPVRLMGWLIHHYSRWVFNWFKAPSLKAPRGDRQFWERAGLRLAGIFLTLGLVGGSGAIAALLIRWVHHWQPWLGLMVETILLASCLAGRSLRAAAEQVLDALGRGDLETARSRLSQYVGRDTQTLSAPEVLRAVLETVTENATDGVMAPLFYALLGLALPGIGSVPLALAYKAASTLDSMIGYRDPPYTDLGWCSARLEDLLTWLPCRLSVLTLALLSGHPWRVWRLCWRDASQDPSPNAGWSECAYAAALGVQMGGLNWYRGVAKFKPLLGDASQPITPDRIHQALRLTRYNVLLWIAIASLAVISS